MLDWYRRAVCAAPRQPAATVQTRVRHSVRGEEQEPTTGSHADSGASRWHSATDGSSASCYAQSLTRLRHGTYARTIPHYRGASFSEPRGTPHFVKLAQACVKAVAKRLAPAPVTAAMGAKVGLASVRLRVGCASASRTYCTHAFPTTRVDRRSVSWLVS